MSTVVPEHFVQIKEIIAKQIGVEVSGLKDSTHLVDELGADSLKLIDILSAIEMEFNIVIAMDDLPDMVSVDAAYQITARAAGW
ncbi:acyl carrier protein [Streptacidiphilus melanogenes]|uniref:acyl carrier protein n=1 Tax=Streptacidiphilus melanogenes TaxID=411235 RepID=UPI0005A6A1DE|nr:phosphopantetheine-binding protein [Streptacidiphilus melanogenes]